MDGKSMKGIAIVAVVMAIVAQVVNTAVSFLTMGYYTDPVYLGVWSKVMMPAIAGPPPASFFVLSLVFGLVVWAFFGYAYYLLGNALKVKDAMRKGAKFGAIVWLVSGLSAMLMQYLLFNLPAALIAVWAVSGLVIYVIGGAVAAKFIKQ